MRNMDSPLRFGHYEVLQDEAGKPVELGRGNMGITYKAYDPSLHRTVALKVINFENFPGGSARERFLREARAAARLVHPNVATVFQFGEQDGTYFYAMEFVEGENLDSFIKREGVLPGRLALRIVKHVASALSAADAAGIVHRDIKPANLMIVRDARGDVAVKVIDFGLAKNIGPRDGADPTLVSTGFVGTIHFASPEQIEGGDVDIRSDIYSLGTTLWYMLAGRTPFQGSLSKVIFHQVHEPPPLHLLGAPVEIVQLLKSMLEKEPTGRPQTPVELIQKIEQVEPKVAPDFVCRFSDADGKPSVSVTLQEVLRMRSLLPLEEVIPLLMRIATAVEKEWVVEGGKLDFHLNAIQVEFARFDGGSSEVLMRRSICEWPDYSVNVSRLPTDSTAALAAEFGETIDASAPFIPSKNCVPVLARLAYELLGGDPGRLGGDTNKWSPLAVLTEQGNEVLKTALGDTHARAFASAPEFCAALESTSRERAGLKGRRVVPNGGIHVEVGRAADVSVVSTGPSSGGAVPTVMNRWLDQSRWSSVAGLGGLIAIAVGAFFFSRNYFDPRGRGDHRRDDIAGDLTAPFENSLGMHFVPVSIAGSDGDPKILFARLETTVAQYGAFLRANGRSPAQATFPQGEDHPVVNVTWNDAVEFSAWLTKTETAEKRIPPGTRYRLPTDHEWSCAAGIGDREEPSKSPKDKRGGLPGVYPWGSVWPPPAQAGNYADASAAKADSVQVVIEGYDDGFAQTCPVETFPPNALGIYGIGGNASEWCEDWYDADKKDARTVRGACWRDSDEFYLRSSFRGSFDPEKGFAGYGFRCVLEVPTQR